MNDWTVPVYGARYECETCGRRWASASAAAWCCDDEDDAGMTTARDWPTHHWQAAFDKLLADWAKLKGVSLDVARIYWPTDTPPIHTIPASLSMEATR